MIQASQPTQPSPRSSVPEFSEPRGSQTPGGTINTVRLTPEEEENILWEPGDVYEILCGNLSNTGSRKFRMANMGPEHTMRMFYFESSNPKWKSQEWSLSTESELTNGPAMLVLLRRGDTASIFGVVSMVNRAWTHAMPLGANSLIEKSSKAKALESMHMTSLAKGVGIAILGGMVPGVGGYFGKKAILKESRPLTQTYESIAASARTFMLRIAMNADTYWNGSGNSTSGKL